MGHSQIRIDPWTYLFGAMLLLTVPLPWLAAAVTAAAFHEVCHLGAIALLGGTVTEIQIGPRGAQIGTRLPGKVQELLCALAGPAGSFLLGCLCRFFPRLAICGWIQGLFNLLPIYPLDGGRVLCCCLELLWPGQGQPLGERIGAGAVLALAVITIPILPKAAVGGLGTLGILWLWSAAALRKKPCKSC